MTTRISIYFFFSICMYVYMDLLTYIHYILENAI